MRYFQHDTDSRTNRKLRKVLRTHGPTGYAIWWALLEELCQADDDGFELKADELWLESLAESMVISDPRTLTRVFDTFAEVGLISAQLWAEHYIATEKIKERGDNYVRQKSLNAKRQAEFRKRKAEIEASMSQGSNALRNVISNDVTPSEAEAYSDPKESFKKEKSTRTAASFYSEFQDVYNTGKPQKWASIVVMNDNRKKIAKQLAKDCGGEIKAIEVLQGALRAASLDAWYPGKCLSFENFASNGKIIQLYERQAEEAGDIGSQLTQDAIGAELTRLGVSGLLPQDWSQRTGCTTVSELSGKDAGDYLNWLRQQEASHAA